jgi:hypothetical protein
MPPRAEASCVWNRSEKLKLMLLNPARALPKTRAGLLPVPFTYEAAVIKAAVASVAA